MRSQSSVRLLAQFVYSALLQTEIRSGNEFILGVWGHWSSSGRQVCLEQLCSFCFVLCSACLILFLKLYTDGELCGNFSRRVTVSIECNHDDFKIGNLVETATCDYDLSFHIPIACDLIPGSLERSGRPSPLAALTAFLARKTADKPSEKHTPFRWPWQRDGTTVSRKSYK